MADVLEGSRGRVGNGHADALSSADTGVALGAEIEVVLAVAALGHLGCPGGDIVVAPGDVLHGHDGAFILPRLHVRGGIAPPVRHPIVLAVGGVVSHVAVHGIAVHQNGGVAAVEHITVFVKAQHGVAGIALFQDDLLGRVFRAGHDGAAHSNAGEHRQRAKQCQHSFFLHMLETSFLVPVRIFLVPLPGAHQAVAWLHLWLTTGKTA